MLTTTLRGMVANKLRLFLTSSAVALGVAFLAGSLILTDTMLLAFDQLFGKVASGTDAVVRQHTDYETSGGSRAPVPAGALDGARRVDGVRAAEGVVEGYALITDTAGRAVHAAPGAPTLGANLPADEILRGDVELRSGRAPSGPGEVVIDVTSARENDIALGSDVKVLFHGPAEVFTVVGTVGFGGQDDLGGSTAAYFDTATAQRVLGKPDAFDHVIVSADPGVDAAELTRRLNASLPEGTEAVTGRTVAQESSDAIAKDLGFVTKMFLGFAGIAVFVASFIIWNTFTMTVSQRSREIALLRAVGATRRQVLRGLLLEALLLGFGASVIGLGLGVVVAKGLSALMSVVGFAVPSASTQIHLRTIVVSLLVGTLVTVVAALSPARRATKVLPVEALREAVPGSRPPSRTRGVVGALLSAGGVTALLLGLFAGAGIVLVGVGVLAIVFGVTTLAPMATRPLAAAVGGPLRLRGLPGDLARLNAMRNPRRTASTAAALMIGLALVVGVSVFASSLKSSVGEVLGGSTKADLFLARATMNGPGFSTDIAGIVASVPGVRTVSPAGYGRARFDGQETTYNSVDPATAEDVLNLDVSAGSARDLGTDGVLVARKTADAHGWAVGDTLPAEFMAAGATSLRIAGIYDATGGFINGDYIISLAAQEANDGAMLHSAGLVLVDPGADRDQVQQRIAAAIADHPDAKVLDQGQYEKESGGFVDQLLMFVSVMLLLAVVIALLGIVNTLALSVFERTRELGLLRAVGMTRSQVRAMVRWESVVISLIGALAGTGLGVGLGIALARALRDEGITSITVPAPSIALYVAAAAVAGVLAAIGPARSAAKVDVLKAVVTD
jgi:putative ABC transport system permease protein